MPENCDVPPVCHLFLLSVSGGVVEKRLFRGLECTQTKYISSATHCAGLGWMTISSHRDVASSSRGLGIPSP